MAKTKSTLEFYGYDYDSTMVKKDENYKDETFEISKVIEQQNRKYIKMDTVNNENKNDESNG
jgi:hypothetical protein